MKTIYGNEILYMEQGRCEWGGNGYVEAHYRYKLLDCNYVDSGLAQQFTAAQAHEFASINNLNIISPLDRE